MTWHWHVEWHPRQTFPGYCIMLQISEVKGFNVHSMSCYNETMVYCIFSFPLETLLTSEVNVRFKNHKKYQSSVLLLFLTYDLPFAHDYMAFSRLWNVHALLHFCAFAAAQFCSVCLVYLFCYILISPYFLFSSSCMLHSVGAMS